ncbi:hypothetical protein AQUCO_06700040v1 [Aquilegia coerulea]|uniref:Uncharacterized protein n=1 Tax=Aquilegia coerulea TaxID=218851 RepID=A0A2G5CBT1_AQUCA|nr:hypothetical protein AQUCO_06700040v1 [Aquilegia coerulea]
MGKVAEIAKRNPDDELELDEQVCINFQTKRIRNSCPIENDDSYYSSNEEDDDDDVSVPLSSVAPAFITSSTSDSEEEQGDNSDDSIPPLSSVARQRGPTVSSSDSEEEQGDNCDDSIPPLSSVARQRGPTVSSSESVLIGQMNVASCHVELYKRLINKFGEIVSSPSLPKFMVQPTCAAINDLLDSVTAMLDTIPETISQEKVSEWKEMISFYSGMGLKVAWLQDRVRLYDDWLFTRSSGNVGLMKAKVLAKQYMLEARRKEVSTLESELQVLCAELETESNIQSRFNFSFFD